MPFQTGFAGVFEGWTRLELIQKVLRGLHQPVDTPGTSTTSDYNRYPKQDIVDKLVEGQIEFVSLTDSLTTFAIVETVQDQSEYRYPSEALKILSAQFYNATTRYEELVILSSKQQMKRVSNTWKTDSGGTPERLYPSYNHSERTSTIWHHIPLCIPSPLCICLFGSEPPQPDASLTGFHCLGFSLWRPGLC